MASSNSNVATTGIPLYGDAIQNMWDPTSLAFSFAAMSSIITRFPIVAVEVKFPGVVHHPVPGDLTGRTYRTLRANVNDLPLIQIAFSFSDGRRLYPSTWEFNFRKFDVTCVPHDPSSIELLPKSGMDFDLNRKKDVKAVQFAQFFKQYAFVGNENITWVTFRGNFALGYLAKLLSGADLPETLDGFKILARELFPVFYDIEHLALFHGIRSQGVVDNVALPFDVQRGSSRLASFDSLIVVQCFPKMVDRYIHGGVEQFRGVFFDLIE